MVRITPVLSTMWQELQQQIQHPFTLWDGYITTCNQAYVYQVQTTIAITESVTLSLGQNVVSGSLSETTSSTNAYQYDFPSNGYWNVQLLNPSNHYSALAFYYVGPNGC